MTGNMGFDPSNLPPSTSNRKTLENVHKQVESAMGRLSMALERGSVSRAECQIWAYVLRKAAEALDKLAESMAKPQETNFSQLNQE